MTTLVHKHWMPTLALFTLTMFPATLLAQDDEGTPTEDVEIMPLEIEPLITDRPDVAESSRTVGKYTFQVELGADITDPAMDERTVVFPLKVRQGVSDNFELHLETDTFQISQDDSGLTSPELGFKWHLGDKPDAWSIGLLSAVSIPLNDEQGVVFSPTLAFDFDLGKDFGLGTNVGATIFLSPRDTQADNARFAMSLGKGWNDRLSTFIEGFGEATFSGTLTLATDAGVTYLITPNMQFDAYVRQGLYQRSDLGAGLGFSFRI